MSYPTILYVEDDEMNREVIEILLTQILGYDAPGQVVCFESSRNIVERIMALPQKPDLILLDIQLMPYNGIQVLEMLRALPAFQSTCIAAITASVMSDDMDRLMDAGFDGCIGKPFDPNKFEIAIQNLLDGKHVWLLR